MQKLPSSISNSKKKNKTDDDSYHMCFELLQKEDKLNPSIYIMWKENTKYSVFKDLHRSYSDKIFRHEPFRSKNGSISNKKNDIYLNSMLNYRLPNIRYQGEPLFCCCISRANLKIRILLMQ